ncbi:TLL1 [Branchiostoma lanceolatum]|uniref:TLL1 protein n=1 Tax=Branchiostoma lanceolatum TaxID=7740 RepID=A0A8K0ADE9_BRALA|nr:TLL1 [Branchiostoma lanceolatum]
MEGRYVGVRLPGSSRVLSLCEVQIFSSTYDDRRGWKRHGPSSFKVFTDTLKTHGDAKAACAAEDGATLAIVKDQATLDFIASLQNQQADGIANVYIGLNEITSEGNYVWEDGSDIGNFHPWEPGQPNNYRGNEDCFWMTGPSNANPHTWNDITCSSLAGYVCQKTFIGTCQVVASGSGGEVQSPPVPEVALYPSDVSCESLVTVARGQRVELTFSSFSVEAHANCGYDYVEFFDSVGDSWKSLGKFCGNTPPDTICSVGSAVKIVFHTDQGTPSSFSVAWQPKDAIFSNEALAGCSAPYVAEAITCPPLAAPVNGTMTSGHGHSYQDEVQFTCKAGFILEGASSVRCRADGRWTSMLPTCTSCQSPLGMESGDISDSDVTASSISSPLYSSHYGRLNGVLGAAAWCAGQHVRGQWLQVYLGVVAVSGVITQGRDQSDQRVTSYKLHFSWDGTTFAPYKNQDLSDRMTPRGANLEGGRSPAKAGRPPAWHGVTTSIADCDTRPSTSRATTPTQSRLVFLTAELSPYPETARATNAFLVNLKNAVDNVQQEGRWVWEDGVALGSFRPWGPGEPNIHGGNEDCAEYELANDTWNDISCSETSRKFLCQVAPS